MKFILSFILLKGPTNFNRWEKSLAWKNHGSFLLWQTDDHWWHGLFCIPKGLQDISTPNFNPGFFNHKLQPRTFHRQTSILDFLTPDYSTMNFSTPDGRRTFHPDFLSPDFSTMSNSSPIVGVWGWRAHGWGVHGWGVHGWGVHG